MTEEHQTFKIKGVSEDCAPSILRGFSAPVKLIYPQQTLEDLVFLMAFDIDPVNKWLAAHSIMLHIVVTRARQVTVNREALFSPLPTPYIGALSQILKQPDLDNAMKVRTFYTTERHNTNQLSRPASLASTARNSLPPLPLELCWQSMGS